MLNTLTEHDSIPKTGGAATAGKVIERKRIDAWLAERLSKAATSGMFAEVVTLTPVLAQALLDSNPSNRNVSELRKQKLVADIAENRFQLNGESMIVADTGQLNNGQHRCHAVIESGKAVQTLMVFGAPRESRMTVDTGSPRTSGHFLAMAGYKAGNHLAAVAAAIWQWQEYGRLDSSGRMRPSTQQTLSIVEAYPSIADSFAFVSRKGAGRICSVSMLAFAHWAITQTARKPDTVATFFDRLIDGDDLSKGSPILACRNRLLELRTSAAARAAPNHRVEVIFRGWNSWRAGERRKRSIPLMGGKLPELRA